MNWLRTAAILAAFFLCTTETFAQAGQAGVNAPVGTGSGPEACEGERTFDSPDAYGAFLRACPAAARRQQMLEDMSLLIGKRKDAYGQYKKISLEIPDLLPYIPYQYQLALVGPEGLRVHDCVGRIKAGEDPAVLYEEIRKRNGMYRDFSPTEIDTLKEMGLTAGIIQAMLDSTWDAQQRKEAKQRQVSYQQAGQYGGASYSGDDAMRDAVVSCAALVAATRACDRLSHSFARSLCKATAESQFSCN